MAVAQAGCWFNALAENDAAFLELSALGAALATSLRASGQRGCLGDYAFPSVAWGPTDEVNCKAAPLAKLSDSDVRGWGRCAPHELPSSTPGARSPWSCCGQPAWVGGAEGCGALEPGEPAFVHLGGRAAFEGPFPQAFSGSPGAATIHSTWETSFGGGAAEARGSSESPKTHCQGTVLPQRMHRPQWEEARGGARPSSAQASSSETSPRSSVAETAAPVPSKRVVGRSLARFVCCVPLSQVADFQLVPRIIGTGGSNVKAVASACGGKVRVRGRGSGYLEGPDRREADIPLQVVLSCNDAQSLETGVRMLSQLLNQMGEHYSQYCKKVDLKPPARFYALKFRDQ
mmetsp:Transcript_120310/g.334683  ORF Transcript_120310/g.334683 Transcript_120310/m.334683 type:complete len:345 (-) Transcript_120310:404-1438(-)